jgi:DNA-directed RNA polymerase subunit beta
MASRDEQLAEVLAGSTVESFREKKKGARNLFKIGTRLKAKDLEGIDFPSIDWEDAALKEHKADSRLKEIVSAAKEKIATIREKTKERIEKIRQRDDLPPGVVQLVKVYVAQKRRVSVGDKMAGRHGNKGIVARIVPEEDMPFLPDGTSVDIVLNPLGVPSRMNVGQILETHLGWAARILGFEAKTPVFRGADEAEIGVLLRLAGFRWAAESLRLRKAAPVLAPSAITRMVQDLKKVVPEGEHATVLEAGVGLLGARGASADTKELFQQVRTFLTEAAKELGERELEQRRQEVAFHEVAAEEDTGKDGKAIAKAQKELEKSAAATPAEALIAAGKPHLAALLGGKAEGEVDGAADELLRSAGLTPAGKARLRDGRTGQFFEGEVTVGSIYMLKLSHLVDDKIHARSIGPYSLVTQQPLAGKAQFGGQRFGEMEVWALEAYGAAHVLQEMLTVKSDDVNGRSKVYEAIVKGQNLPEPGIPESFNVLVKELQALGLKVTLGTTEAGDE